MNLELDALNDPEPVAEYLGVNERTLANWRSERRGPKYVKVGSYVKYRAGDVLDWVARRTVAPESDESAR